MKNGEDEEANRRSVLQYLIMIKRYIEDYKSGKIAYNAASKGVHELTLLLPQGFVFAMIMDGADSVICAYIKAFNKIIHFFLHNLNT